MLIKKLFTMVLSLVVVFSLAGCGQDDTQSEASEKISVNTTNNENKIPITLTIGDTVLDGYLNDSAPAKSLIAQLPMTVTLNDSDNDFCGDNINIEYTQNDVTSGYKNGELAFWTPANNFVIFVSGEENSANIGDLVKLGQITSTQEMLDKLNGQINVTIALKEKIDKTINEEENKNMRIKITVGDSVAYATLENNSTTRALISQMPMTLQMSNLYNREMCYRYGAGALPTDNLRSDGYEIGDIAYWPPRGSLVILYAQNGEQFERQHLGHIDSGIDIFQNIGDAEVTFELIK